MAPHCQAEGGGLMTTDEIAARVIAAKGFDTGDTVLRGVTRDQMLTVLPSFRN